MAQPAKTSPAEGNPAAEEEEAAEEAVPEEPKPDFRDAIDDDEWLQPFLESKVRPRKPSLWEKWYKEKVPEEAREFIEENKFELIGTTTTFGFLVSTFFIRRNYLMTTFRHVTEIPSRFVADSRSLKGKVRKVDLHGRLYVQHQSALPNPFSYWIPSYRELCCDPPDPSGKSGCAEKPCPCPCPEKKPLPPLSPNTGLITLHLAGIELCRPSILWLMNRLPDKRIKFQILHRHENHLACSVCLVKQFKDINVNEALLLNGLAKVRPLRPCLDPPGCCPDLATCCHSSACCDGSPTGCSDDKTPALAPKITKGYKCPCDRSSNKEDSLSPYDGGLIPCADAPRPCSKLPNDCLDTREFRTPGAVNTAYQRVYIGLLDCEAKARKKNAGIWKEVSRIPPL